MSNFFEFQANGNKDAEAKPQTQEAVVQDQDTVIGDAMCEASQLFYDAANQIARCISENNQCAIDNHLLRKAELALVFMQGADFGLAMDDNVQKWYLCEMEKSMASIKNSQALAFQNQIYVPPPPAELMGFDARRARDGFFIQRCFNEIPPNKDYVEHIEEEIVKDDSLKYLFEKGFLDMTKFKGALKKYGGSIKFEEKEEIEDSPVADKKPYRRFLTVEECKDRAKKNGEVEQVVSDDSQSVLNLRNLYRQNRIDKSQYIGGLATLVATGLISKSEFTRLKTSA